MKVQTISIIFLLFFIGTTIAQEAIIDINQTGFGKTQEEVYFTVHNLGKIPITKVTIFVDGKESQNIEGTTSSGKGFGFLLYLEPGEHLIEARTPEGAYDSVNVTVSSLPEKPYKPPEENKSFLEENIMIIGLVALVIIIVIIIWLFSRKPRLKL